MLFFTNQLGYHNNYMINVNEIAYVLDKHDHIILQLLDIVGQVHTLRYSIPYKKSMTTEQFETLILAIRILFQSDKADDAKIDQVIRKVIRTFDTSSELDY